MTKERFSEVRKQLKLAQREVAELVGVNLRTAQRWEYGESPIPLAVEKLLEILAKKKGK